MIRDLFQAKLLIMRSNASGNLVRFLYFCLFHEYNLVEGSTNAVIRGDKLCIVLSVTRNTPKAASFAQLQAKKSYFTPRVALNVANQ
jgi:hypothetical protein